MKLNLHRTAAAKRTPAFGSDTGRDQDAARPLNLGMPENDGPAPEIRQYTVPLHIVFTHDSSVLPAQIPWLEEIRGDQFLSDLHAEVI